MKNKGGMFSYADNIDKLLMLFGTLGCIGDGMMMPGFMFVLSGLLGTYGSDELHSTDISSPNHTVDKYGLKLLYIATGVGLSAFVEGVCRTRTAERQTSRLRTEYLRSVLRQDVGFFDSQGASSTTFQVISGISSDAQSIQDVIAEKIPQFMVSFFTVIGCLIVSFLLSWRMAVAALPLTLLFIAPGLGFGKLMMQLGIKMKDSYGVAGEIAEQAISSIRTVYSSVGEHQTQNRFSKALQKNEEAGIKQGFTKGLLLGSMGMIYINYACQAWVGSVLVTEKGESGGRVFISGVCVILGGVSLMSALPNISFFSEAKAAATRIFELIDQVPLIDTEDEKGEILDSVTGEIEFREINFNYLSRPDTPILQGFNLKVQAGKTVGLVGGSGSGKSTVISLLERFYDPIKGEILLDGCTIKRLQLRWLRSQMGLVSQEPILFATSIKKNILFGREGASMENVIAAAKAANAHNFITKFSKGYDTQVSHSLFGFFRYVKGYLMLDEHDLLNAYLRDPKILLLDEATSALDAQSEKLVQDALDQASVGRTTITIAHRLTTICKANMIVVMQNGRVLESGSHDELMQITNEGGAYLRMVQLQQSATQKQVNGNSDHPSNARSHHRINSFSSCHISSYKALSMQGSSPVMENIHVDSEALSFEVQPHVDSGGENMKKSSYPLPSQWRLQQMNAPEWKVSLLGCFGAIGSGAVQPVYSYCMGTLISVYLLKDNYKVKSESKLYSSIFLCLGALSFITNLLQHYNFAIMVERLTKRIREKILQKLITFEIGWFDKDENTSALLCALLDIEAKMVRSLVGDRMSLLVQVFTTAFISYTLALMITWRMAIVMISMQPLLIGSFYAKNTLMKTMSKKARKAQNKGSQLASEAVVSHRTITAFSLQDRILGLFAVTMEGPRKEIITQAWFSGVGLFSSQFISTASTALAFWYGGRLLNHGLISSKQLFQAFFILMSTSKTIADAGSMTSDLAKGSRAVRSLFTILDRKTEIEPDDPKGIKVDLDIKGNIELKNVFFSYPSRPNEMVFKSLNLKIDAGKTVALIGNSGSGKSTIIGLIERFYDPLKGSILIDGLDIKAYNLRSLRSHIALVSQEPTLFAGTIRQNIAYGKEDSMESELTEAAILASAHDFISSMKEGYETYCGERGVQLSGGQKQRIVLARAFLKKPSIFLLDEATSALDSETENLVQKALDEMMFGKTCVVVAHRLSTIQKSDTIVAIKEGKVEEQGSHSDLLAIGKGGYYYSLLKLQSTATTN
ncbi:hypothetical protein Vadar_013626 [Vaccinium darrowii]|uniref:Uncharacterized protein n=1 Tax=Vaccinium darrowii TaxID=229202 RepID=A0ACB7YV78_9ERIC|nr:hypothetical protein Vadar_013626 [Vaccinium darrowii]